MTFSAVVILLAGFVVPLMLAVVAIRRLKLARQVRLARLKAETKSKGWLLVPVKELELSGGFFSTSKNSIWPLLTITKTGIRFQIFKEKSWAFADIRQVDLRKSLFGAELAFSSQNGQCLRAVVDDAAVAKNVLTALPRSVSLGKRATELLSSTEK